MDVRQESLQSPDFLWRVVLGVVGAMDADHGIFAAVHREQRSRQVPDIDLPAERRTDVRRGGAADAPTVAK